MSEDMVDDDNFNIPSTASYNATIWHTLTRKWKIDFSINYELLLQVSIKVRRADRHRWRAKWRRVWLTAQTTRCLILQSLYGYSETQLDFITRIFQFHWNFCQPLAFLVRAGWPCHESCWIAWALGQCLTNPSRSCHSPWRQCSWGPQFQIGLCQDQSWVVYKEKRRFEKWK